jgi:aminoglycoside 6'-N-acetyltransferase I
MTIRPLSPRDLDAVAGMCAALWPDGAVAHHRGELEAILRGTAGGAYPYRVFVADDDGRVLGFVLAGMRSHADGCDPAKPVGYLEGWYVDAASRKQGIGRALIEAAEQWARAAGCAEMASDTWADNEGSQHAHAALGYEEVDRCVHYRKRL